MRRTFFSAFGPRTICTVALMALCVILAAPPAAQAQQSATGGDFAEREALPASPRAAMFGAGQVGQEAAAARIEAERAARLGGKVALPAATANVASEVPGGASTRGPSSPMGNARFPAWNLPLRTEGRGMVYANAAYGQITNEFDNDEEFVPLGGGDIEQSLGLPEIAQLLGLDPEAAAGAPIMANVNVPGNVDAQVNTVNINLGGAFAVYSTSLFDLSLGADFQASQQNLSADVSLFVDEARGNLDYAGALNNIGIEDVVDGSVEDIRSSLAAANEQLGLGLTIPPAGSIPSTIEMDSDAESGFQTQALTLFAQAKSRFLSVRGGYQFDLGDTPEAADEREVSDRQNAILLGFTGSYPATEALRVYGGVDGWFTFENEETIATGGTEVTTTYDEGNSYAAQVGADYNIIPSVALGASLTYRYRTEGSIAAETVGGTQVQQEAEGSGYHLGISPYVNYNPADLPVTLYLKGGVRDEYRDFSFSLIGENEFAPRAGATLGAVYHF